MFGTTFGLPQNAFASCVSYLESTTIAGAYNGDLQPTVHEMQTCNGDDTGYQIPIATTITFDGVQYDNIYATTNSVITFGQLDPTFHTYPSTPSISLYSMDWYPGINNAPNGLDIYYSEGGFQINMQAIPFGQWDAQPSNINILVAITNTGGLAVTYSYQGPQYEGMRTGVRLHDGSIVSLEAWGATQTQPGESTPTLSSEPVVVGPTQEELIQQEEIRVLNSSLAAAVGAANIIMPEPDIVEPEILEPEVVEPEIPEPDVVVEPEIITPEDPRFPDDNEEQTEPVVPNPEPSSDATNEETVDPIPEPENTEEPAVEPSPQPTDTTPTEEPQPEESPKPIVQPTPPSNNSTGDLLKQLSNITNKDTLLELTAEQQNAVSKTLGIKSEELLIVAQLVESDQAVANAIMSFAEKAEDNADAPMPYTLADAIAEEKTEQLLADPVGTLTSMFTELNPEILLSPSEWGKDMTDDQREKVQEIVVSVIIAGNLISASMTRRIG